MNIVSLLNTPLRDIGPESDMEPFRYPTDPRSQYISYGGESSPMSHPFALNMGRLSVAIEEQFASRMDEDCLTDNEDLPIDHINLHQIHHSHSQITSSCPQGSMCGASDLYHVNHGYTTYPVRIPPPGLEMIDPIFHEETTYNYPTSPQRITPYLDNRIMSSLPTCTPCIEMASPISSHSEEQNSPPIIQKTGIDKQTEHSYLPAIQTTNGDWHGNPVPYLWDTALTEKAPSNHSSRATTSFGGGPPAVPYVIDGYDHEKVFLISETIRLFLEMSEAAAEEQKIELERVEIAAESKILLKLQIVEKPEAIENTKRKRDKGKGKKEKKQRDRKGEKVALMKNRSRAGITKVAAV